MSVSISDFNDVVNFHQKFGVPVLNEPGFLSELAPDAAKFRVGFLQEELDEFKKSLEDKDLVGAYDALLDLVYVAYGTANMMGVSPEMWQELWDNVQTANMSKVRATSASQSKRGTSLDVVKPAGWVSPETKHAETLAKFAKANK